MRIRHQRGRNIKLSNILQIDENVWHVKSQTLLDELYIVQKKWNECELMYCGKRCDRCHVCIHEYSCSCPDYSENSQLCKHIHAIFNDSDESDSDLTSYEDVETDHERSFQKYNKMETRHERGTKIEASDIICVRQNIWHVESQTLNNARYVVEKIDGCPCYPMHCGFYCTHCHDCTHRFSCSCPDYSEHSNLCKHIHAVCILSDNQSEQDTEEESSDDDCIERIDNDKILFDIRHLRGMEVECKNIIIVEENKGDVTSQTIQYSVKKISDSCPMKNCKSFCIKCKVCIHMFSCDCPDYFTNSNLCKHIHAVSDDTLIPDTDNGKNISSNTHVANLTFEKGGHQMGAPINSKKETVKIQTDGSSSSKRKMKGSSKYSKKSKTMGN
ncbi:hypothetical protein JTB14_032500 [Gonioctena quinquepunctata]|nr:hypothetical protein JTB14_032500 [Gonioctena quinquepunctata]